MDFLSPKNDEIDFDAAAAQFPDIDLDGSDTLIPASAVSRATSNAEFLDFDDFDHHAGQEVKVTGDDEIEKFEDNFPAIDVPASAPVLQQPSSVSHSPAVTFAPKPQTSYTPILTQNIEEDEPEVIREWREKQQEEIAKREEKAKARRQDTISSAERSIDQFYEDYSGKKERNIRENKDAEAEFLDSLKAALSTGTTWSRICDVIELQNSQSKTLARTGANTTELGRFKEVLLRLKREGDHAPGAGGY